VGQKVNPYGLRLGINKTWKSKWYVDPRDYASTLHEDLRLRRTIDKSPETQGADISDVEIIRHPQRRSQGLFIENAPFVGEHGEPARRSELYHGYSFRLPVLTLYR
jgi:ribosomal protein S3